MKVQEYEKEKLMNKIEEKMTKAQQIQREREQLLDQRQVMKKEIEKQKRDMMDKIEKVKQGKIDPNELLKSLSKESPQTISIIQADKQKQTITSNENSKIRIKQNQSLENSRKAEKTEPSKKTEEDAKR
jgi:TnpA family transposase